MSARSRRENCLPADSSQFIIRSGCRSGLAMRYRYSSRLRYPTATVPLTVKPRPGLMAKPACGTHCVSNISLRATRRPPLRLTMPRARLCDRVRYGEYSVMRRRLMVVMEPSVWMLPPDTGISPE